MRLIGISTVKNESDIIESFVRHNLRFLDRLHVVDNGSTDTTGQILAELARALPALTVEHDPYPGHAQERKLTEVARLLAEKEPFDFLFPVDADEYLRCASRGALEKALAGVPAGSTGAIPWMTYVSTQEDDSSEPDPARRIRNRWAVEPKPMSKVAVPAALVASRGFRFSPGNHRASLGGADWVPEVPLQGVALAHFPLRSSAQLASKVLLGEWALREKPGRLPHEGWHWRAFAEEIERDPHVPDERFFALAAVYNGTGMGERVLDPIELAPDHRLELVGRIEVDLLKRVVSFSGGRFAALARALHENTYMAIGKTAAGLMAYPRSDRAAGRSLALYGEWAGKEIKLLEGLLRPGDNVVDVGAGFGTHAVRFGQRVGPSGTVHAFEPRRLACQFLCANAMLNQLVNVHAHQLAAGDSEGEVMIGGDGSRGDAGIAGPEGAQGGMSVRQVPLDGMELASVRLIRIDVGGGEEAVLRGASRLIARDRPLLFVANGMPGRSQSLLRAIAALGYGAWWHFEPHYNPDNYFRNRVNALSSLPRPRINVLALPSGAQASHPSLVPVRDVSETWEAAHARLPSRS